MNFSTKNIINGLIIVLCISLLSSFIFLHFKNHYLSAPLSTIQEWHPLSGNLIYLLIRQRINIALLVGFLGLVLWPIILYKNKLKTISFIGFGTFLFVVLLLGVAEITLAFLGYKPGFNQPLLWFQPVETLDVYEGFEADSVGITKFPTEAIDYNKTMMEKAIAFESLNCCPLQESLYTETYDMWTFHFQVIQGVIQNEFSKKLADIQTSKQMSAFDSLFLNYAYYPINPDGFKSIPFSNNIKDKKKILLLGDSFTFGHHVENITSGFADILLSKEYLVYNTGISGADMMQYYLIAKEYIPLIKPDIVIMNTYLGNDLSYSHRNPESFLPIYFTTNAGNLYTNIEGENYSDPNELYDKVLNNYLVSPKTVWSKLVCKSRIGTKIWAKLNPTTSHYPTASLSQKKYAFIDEVKQIEQLCKAKNSAFILTSIPDCSNMQLKKANEFLEFFNHFQYFEPKDINVLDYVRNDGHFNEKGHQKYALFLQNIIDSTFTYQALRNDSLEND